MSKKVKTSDYMTDILIVEDSDTQAMQIKNLLDNNGYDGIIAKNGEKALDWLADNRPMLVISDIIMPEMNGYELCKKIKSNKATEDILVILLTGLSDTDEIIEGLSCGADSFITKPYNEEYLLSHIEKILTTQLDEEKIPFTTKITYKGKKHYIQSQQQSVINLLLDIYEMAVQKNDILSISQNEILSLNEKLQQQNREKDKFFSIISHDLRSPISSYISGSQLLSDELESIDPKDLKDLVLNMNSSAKNVFKLLENLLEWSKIKLGNMDFKIEKLNLRKSVTESILLLEGEAKMKGIKVIDSIPDGLKVAADKNMFHSLIRNLISNAIKFTPTGGTVKVKSFIGNYNSVEIEVIDSGIGMDTELVNNLFRLDYNSGRKGTAGEPSSGLGLILCKEFVERHGWKIQVDSEVGKGSTFSITVPEIV